MFTRILEKYYVFDRNAILFTSMFVVYLETKIEAISLISIVGEAHNGRQETLEQRDAERGKREVVFLR